jgi:AraC-like DNA-binding protein
MRQDETGIAMFRYSTEGLADQDKLESWRNVIGQALAKADFEPAPGAPFSQAAAIRILPLLSLVAGSGSGYRVQRTKAHIAADGGDDFYLQIQLEGTGQVSQFGRQQQIGAGEAILLSGAEPGSKLNPGPVRYINIKVPGETLRAHANNPEAALMRPIAGGNGALQLLKQYLAMVNRSDPQLLGPPASPELASAFTAHVHSLIALALGAVRGDAREATSQGVRAARLQEIKDYIARNLGRTTLSVPEVAERHGVSPRYVQMLFAAEGITFSEFVLGQRLAHARGMLTGQAFASRSISSIAFEVGFADLSHFNKAFRRRFGATPTDVRQAATAHIKAG